MKHPSFKSCGLFAACAAVAMSLPLFAEIEMGTPFSDGAVLQRGMKVPVWGTRSPAEGSVTVEFAGQTKTAGVDATTGKWRIELDAMEASKERRTMTVSSGADKVEIGDVLVGEVWFASGQSNMECPIWGPNTRYRDGKGAMMIAMTRRPFIRYAKNPKHWSAEPRLGWKAAWRDFSPESFAQTADCSLSAVAFYYALELYGALDVPIGIVDSSWGGTNIDAWTPRSGYEGCDESIKTTAEYRVTDKWDAKTDKIGPISKSNQQPTVLWNGMVAAWTPFAIRGFIWYQGCHNNDEANLYCAKLHAPYSGWSRDFENPALKHYIVQLAPWKHNWLGICMAQNKYVSEERNAAIAVTADCGNYYDIHPNDKEIVAKRLALHALRRDYGFDIPEDDSPVLKSAVSADGKVTLSFEHARNWYVYSPDRSRDAAFELAGEDGAWQSAKIVNYRKTRDGKGKETETDFIDGAEIVVASDKVERPVKVRYMGRPRTSGTLYNEASLPLGPFEAEAEEPVGSRSIRADEP